jgi:hypothetical protein
MKLKKVTKDLTPEQIRRVEKFLIPVLHADLDSADLPEDYEVKQWLSQCPERYKLFAHGPLGGRWFDRVQQLLNEAIARLQDAKIEEQKNLPRRLQDPFLHKQQVHVSSGIVHPEVQPRGPAPKTSK